MHGWMGKTQSWHGGGERRVGYCVNGENLQLKSVVREWNVLNAEVSEGQALAGHTAGWMPLLRSLGPHFSPLLLRPVVLTLAPRGWWVVLCFLLLTCHLELSMENRSDWVSSVSFNSEQELDRLKYLMRGGRREWEGTSIKRIFSRKDGGTLLRCTQKREAPLFHLRMVATVASQSSGVSVLRTWRRKALEPPA